MRSSVAVLIPVLDRPQRVAPVAASILETRPTDDVSVFPVFLCSPDDDAEIAAVEAVGADLLVVDWEPGRGDYAKKMNHGWRQTDSDWVFFAADDVVFRHGWLEACFRVFGETEACVIGTNDLGNRTVMSGRHSTHTLVHRDYGECGTVDDPTVILHEGYWHQYVDNEFIETAKWRGTFAPAQDAHVEHMHPFWHKGTLDATYERATNSVRAAEDQALFRRRKGLWA